MSVDVSTALPEKFGKYRVVGLAGHGNMSTVYTGFDPDAGRDVAIKVCRIEPARRNCPPSVARKLALNEVQTAGMLDHPNIVKILDMGEQRGHLFVVMEYVAGSETLADYCQSDTLLPVKTVAEIVYACAKALDYAHRCGVVHRDIKPNNILCGRDGALKIADFGIAKQLQADATEFMGLVGSPAYMAPEQLSDGVAIAQSDLYALGAVMYELLSARRPFHSEVLSALLARICNEEALPVQQLRQGIPDSLASVVHRALAKDLSERYACGREMANDLTGVFADLAPMIETSEDAQRFRHLRYLRFFAEFSDVEIWELLRIGLWRDYQPGERIVTEGSTESSFFVIVSGQLRVTKPAGTAVQLCGGDCFGEMGYLRGAERSVTMTAVDAVSLLKVDSTLMERASQSCQLRFHKAFAHVLTERLSRAVPPPRATRPGNGGPSQSRQP